MHGYQQGVIFPASKEEVASDAESNNASQELVQQIRDSGADTFNSADEFGCGCRRGLQRLLTTDGRPASRRWPPIRANQYCCGATQLGKVTVSDPAVRVWPL